MSEWFETLDGLHAQAWAELANGVVDADHPCRLASFSTLSIDGWPEARFVVVRQANAEAGMVEVQSDLCSSKFTSLRKTPKAALVWWVPAVDLQIRMQADVEISEGPALDEAWAKVPPSSRVSYGTQPPPGTPIANALDYDKTPDRAAFAALRCHISTIDLVHLGAQHRRAGYTRARDWQGQWLSP